MTILEISFTDFADLEGIPDITMRKGYDGSGAIVM
jgi:hypothetical protein